MGKKKGDPSAFPRKRKDHLSEQKKGTNSCTGARDTSQETEGRIPVKRSGLQGSKLGKRVRVRMVKKFVSEGG